MMDTPRKSKAPATPNAPGRGKSPVDDLDDTRKEQKIADDTIKPRYRTKALAVHDQFVNFLLRRHQVRIFVMNESLYHYGLDDAGGSR